jgi:hypothetical protein
MRLHNLSPPDMVTTQIVTVSLNLMNTWNYLTGQNPYQIPNNNAYYKVIYDNLLNQPATLSPPNYYDNPSDYIRMIITIEITG